MAKIGRNELCSCGSGKKYKKCHSGRISISTPIMRIEEAIETMYQDSLALEHKTFAQLGEELAALIGELRSYARVSALAAVAALALVAENRTHVIRIDCLLYLIAMHCNGQNRVTVQALDRWLNEWLARCSLRAREDPAEDVAVAPVMTDSGDFRVFTGDWSNPDYYLQDVLDALQKGPDTLHALRNECYAALRLSELVAARRGYARFAEIQKVKLRQYGCPLVMKHWTSSADKR